MLGNFLYYDDVVIDNLTPSELEKIAENCFTSKTKNYELLARITQRLVPHMYCPLRLAIDLLESKAVKVIIDNYSPEMLNGLNSYVEYYGLKSLMEQLHNFQDSDMSIKDKKQHSFSIAKSLLKHKKVINEEDLSTFAQVASIQEFLDFLLEQQIDLSKMNMTMPLHYAIEGQKPLLQGMNYKSIEDVLLMHTYSLDKSQQEIRMLYSNLLNSSKIATSIMHYTAVNLIKGDDLKIVYIANFTGGYIPHLNIVAIGEMLDNFAPEAVTIHELCHYTLFSLFPSHGMPFNVSNIKLLEQPKDDVYGYHLNSTAISKPSEINIELENLLTYERAAKQVIVKAGQLLGMTEEEFTPYLLSKDFMQYLKDNSPIDLFYDNFVQGYNLSAEMGLSSKKSFADAYYAAAQGRYETTCPIRNNGPFDQEVKFSDMVQFAREQYFPYIIREFSLSNSEIFFLERIAELLNRAKDIYDCPSSYHNKDCPHLAYYQELIVRSAELRANNIDEQTLASFSLLDAYWTENIDPLINHAKSDLLGDDWNRGMFAENH